MEKAAVKAFLMAMPALDQVEEEAIDWLIEKSEINAHKKGDFMFEPGHSVDHLSIYLKGSLDVYMDTPNGRQDLFYIEKGMISGNLPFSRIKSMSAYGRVLEDLEVLELHKSYFVEMVSVSYKLTQALVAVMSDRIRDNSQLQFQDEKLKALGKISAGLAHELNNPISAIARSSETLYDKLSVSPESFSEAMSANFTKEEAEFFSRMITTKIEKWQTAPVQLSLIEQQDRMDELLDWLEDNDVGSAEEISETLVEFDFTEDDLDEINEALSSEDKRSAGILWMEHQLATEILVNEIKLASERVSTLIRSIKDYSHMDQGQGKEEVNLHDGLQTTLTILGHQLKQKQIVVDRQYDNSIPTVTGNPGELNQVWTNLISNAIDAVEPGGKITVWTFMDRDYICVCIEDNGKGIPEENLSHIWEQFFTTKKVGEGTGIGLDVVKKIVQKHKGSIRVESQPGKTRFIVQFWKP